MLVGFKYRCELGNTNSKSYNKNVMVVGYKLIIGNYV